MIRHGLIQFCYIHSLYILPFSYVLPIVCHLCLISFSALLDMVVSQHFLPRSSMEVPFLQNYIAMVLDILDILYYTFATPSGLFSHASRY